MKRFYCLLFFCFLGLVNVGFPSVVAQNFSNNYYQQGFNSINSKLTPSIKEAFTLSAMSQHWGKGIKLLADGTQALLHNWAAGGKSAFSFRTLIDAFSNYRNGYIVWDAELSLGYGAIKNTGDYFSQKTDDHINLTSSISRTLTPYVSSTLMFNFRSQFFNGYSGKGLNRQKTSSFLAPGYIVLSLGGTFHPSQLFNLFLSPMSGRFTIMRDSVLSKAGAYGLNKGDNLRSELGAYLKLVFEKEHFTIVILKNVSIKTMASVFLNYIPSNQLTENNRRAYNGFAFNLENTITFKVNDYINCNFNLSMIYDQAVRFPEKLPDGKIVNEAKFQLKEILGIGFVYDFTGLINKIGKSSNGI